MYKEIKNKTEIPDKKAKIKWDIRETINIFDSGLHYKVTISS